MSCIVLTPKGKSTVFMDLYHLLNNVILTGGFVNHRGYIIDVTSAIRQIKNHLEKSKLKKLNSIFEKYPPNYDGQWLFRLGDYKVVDFAENA